MNKQLKISAKDLGRFAMPNFCPRCFWMLWHMSGDPPFSFFPSIFSHIDSYTKKVVHGQFDRFGRLPAWLGQLGHDVTGFINPPGHRTLQVTYQDEIVLCGTPDAIYRRSDGTLIIGDYKTAYHQNGSDPLLPMYSVQLNVYARLLEAKGYGRTSALYLIYTEPCTDDDAAMEQSNQRDDGFALSFRVITHDVPIDSNTIDACMQRARSIYALTKPPESHPGCKDCHRLFDLITTAKSDGNPYAQIGVPASR